MSTNGKDPTCYDELFPGRFLKAGLFRGKQVTLTIKRVRREQLADGEKPKVVMSFKESEMELVLIKTNAQCIVAMFGAQIVDWIGRKVTFAPEEDYFGPDLVPCIRVAGSPELTGDVEATIKLPKRKPKTRTLRRTG
jgi:hypothetical protein